MPESNINMIITTKREGEAPQETLVELTQMKEGLTDLEKAMAGTRTTIGGLDQDIKLFGTNVGSTADLLNGMGINIPISPMQLFGQAIKAGGQFASEAIGEYAAYGEEISKLAAFTSTSTEEMSRMYQVADDLRIPVGSLEMALKTMADHGVSPSIEGLGQLSDEYLAIQDPLLQAQFLMDNFGRSGQEMARFMGLGSVAIGENANAIADWMIVTGKTEEQINAFMLTQDAWDESIMEVKYSLASGLLPALTGVMNAMMNTQDEVKESETYWLQYIPVVGQVYTVVMGLKNLLAELFGDAAELPATVSEAASQAPTSNRGNIWSESTRFTPGVTGRAGGGDMFPNAIYRVGEREIEYISSPLGGMVTPASQAAQQPIIVNYSPLISTVDRAEAENVLVPVIRAALRRA